MSQIRLFIPKDLKKDELKQTDRLLGFDFSITCRGRSLRTILVKCLDGGHVQCTCKIGYLDRVATQSPALAANIDGSTRSRQAVDHLEIACLQLQTALAVCDVCQIVYYDRPCPGVWHYTTPCSESSLSTALHLLNHQHSATQQRKTILGWLQACLAADPVPHGQKLHTGMLCSEISGLLCRIGTLRSHQKLYSVLASEGAHPSCRMLQYWLPGGRKHLLRCGFRQQIAAAVAAKAACSCPATHCRHMSCSNLAGVPYKMPGWIRLGSGTHQD